MLGTFCFILYACKANQLVLLNIQIELCSYIVLKNTKFMFGKLKI